MALLTERCSHAPQKIGRLITPRPVLRVSPNAVCIFWHALHTFNRNWKPGWQNWAGSWPTVSFPVGRTKTLHWKTGISGFKRALSSIQRLGATRRVDCFPQAEIAYPLAIQLAWGQLLRSHQLTISSVENWYDRNAPSRHEIRGWITELCRTILNSPFRPHFWGRISPFDFSVQTGNRSLIRFGFVILLPVSDSALTCRLQNHRLLH